MLAEQNIRKHVAIIHAYSSMSALQRKLLNILLHEAKNHKVEDIKKESVVVECHMPFTNLVKAVKFNSNNTQYLKEAIDSLASLKIEWNLLKDKVPKTISFLNLRILHGPPTFYQTGIVNFSFHRFLVDLTDDPEIYGKIDLSLQSDFESKYSHSLYENSTRFVNLKRKKIIPLTTFRKLLNVDHGKYSNMREFTRNVIKPSVEEVNDRAEFVISLKNIKTGKSIAGYELSVENKKSIALEKSKENNARKIIQDKIIENFGKISEHILDNILKNYSEEYISEKIIYTKQHTKKQRNDLYPIPYFISALKNDYKLYEKKEKITKEQSSDKSIKWQEEMDLLKGDLQHWRRNLQLSEKNLILKNSLEKIILECERKIQKHLEDQPNPNLKKEP